MKHKTLLTFGLLFYFGLSIAQSNERPVDSSFPNNIINIGGRIHYQMSFFCESDSLKNQLGASQNGTQLRRLYLNLKGKLDKNIKYKFQFGFLNGKIGIRDIHISFLDLPFFDELKVGRFKEPISLEATTSSNHITFIERSMNTDFSLKRNNGFQVNKFFLDKSILWIFGFFQNSTKFGKSTFKNNNFTSKLTYLPVFKENGKYLVHLGLAYSYRNPINSIMTFEAKPEDNLANPYLSKTINDVDKMHLANLELIVQKNAFSLQSEYLHYTPVDKFGDKYFEAFYMEVSYFLTKEHRNYIRKLRNFKEIHPIHNYNRALHQYGALQVAFRISRFDLDQSILKNYTLAVNWFLNPNTRISGSFGIANVDTLGISKIGQMKFQVTF